MSAAYIVFQLIVWAVIVLFCTASAIYHLTKLLRSRQKATVVVALVLAWIFVLLIREPAQAFYSDADKLHTSAVR